MIGSLVQDIMIMQVFISLDPIPAGNHSLGFLILTLRHYQLLWRAVTGVQHAIQWIEVDARAQVASGTKVNDLDLQVSKEANVLEESYSQGCKDSGTCAVMNSDKAVGAESTHCAPSPSAMGPQLAVAVAGPGQLCGLICRRPFVVLVSKTHCLWS